MTRSSSVRWLPIIALTMAAALVSACGEAGPLDVSDPGDLFDAADAQPLATVMPDLAPEVGSEGTDRYVPTLHRVLHRSVRVIKTKRGDEAAAKVLAEVQRLRGEVIAAKEAGDAEAAKRASLRLEGFAARVGLRVFGAPLARHVAKAATEKLQDIGPRLRAAHEAGEDVGRLVKGFQAARKQLDAARKAWENERPAAGLVHAAHALDVATKVGAALGS